MVGVDNENSTNEIQEFRIVECQNSGDMKCYQIVDIYAIELKH